MTVRCIECKHAKGGPHARLGLLRCPDEPKWRFFGANAPRKCAKFALAPADQIAQRVAFLLPATAIK